MSRRIIWIEPETGLSEKQKKALGDFQRRSQLDTSSIYYVNLHRKLSGMGPLLLQKGKTKFVRNRDMTSAYQAAVDKEIASLKPKLIVCNDQAAVNHLAENDHSLPQARGSVYTYKGIPCIPVDSLGSAFAIKYGSWILKQDLDKVKRWMTDTQRKVPKFVYEVCRSVADVRRAVEWLSKCVIFSLDIETANELITCIGYTGIMPDGSCKSWVVPFVNSQKPGGCHWDTLEEEIEVHLLVRQLHLSPPVKVMQNGATYDCTHLIRYRMPVTNYLVDTMHLVHCIWTELPKKLNFIASVFMDYCRYWKDELKGERDERYPLDAQRQDRYWRYNAMDCHTTIFSARFLIVTIAQVGWALSNYNSEFRNAIGPALRMSMTGLKLNEKRRQWYAETLLAEHVKAFEVFKKMVGDEDFNPKSPVQMAQLIYDTFRAQPIKGKGKYAKNNDRSTDEKMLKLIRLQHPLLAKIIDQLWALKKPANNYSKYAMMRVFRGRFMYSLKAGGTETGRYACSMHSFKYGTNAQNVPNSMRAMVQADDGHVLFEPDYSQSDARFVAYESGDPVMINVLETPGMDAHSKHAEQFFKKPYDDIVRGKDAKEDWVVHPVKGVRQNAKRIGHGANYQMSSYTLYITMGREAVVGSAESLHAVVRTVQDSEARGRVIRQYIYIPALGMPPVFAAERWKILREDGPGKWSQSQMVDFCDMMLEEYHVLYKLLRPWFKRTVADAIKNNNRVTCAFGRTRIFFGDIATNKKVQREISAYYGQGGTAGNINRVLNYLEYERRDLYDQGLMVMTQTHDSLLFQIPEQYIHAHASQILTIMEEPFTIRGQTVRIPADGKIGISWGEKSMLGYKPGLTLRELQDQETKVSAKFKPRDLEISHG